MKYKDKLKQQFEGLGKLSGSELRKRRGCTEPRRVHADKAIRYIQYNYTRQDQNKGQ